MIALSIRQGIRTIPLFRPEKPYGHGHASPWQDLAEPDVPVAATAGQPGRRTGTYAQLQAEWTLSRNVSVAAELVHYDVAPGERVAQEATPDGRNATSEVVTSKPHHRQRIERVTFEMVKGKLQQQPMEPSVREDGRYLA